MLNLLSISLNWIRTVLLESESKVSSSSLSDVSTYLIAENDIYNHYQTSTPLSVHGLLIQQCDQIPSIPDSFIQSFILVYGYLLYGTLSQMWFYFNTFSSLRVIFNVEEDETTIFVFCRCWIKTNGLVYFCDTLTRLYTKCDMTIRKYRISNKLEDMKFSGRYDRRRRTVNRFIFYKFWTMISKHTINILET